MPPVSSGDLAQSFVLKQRGVSLQSELTKLSKEISSGIVEDPTKVLGGNVSILADIERDLRVYDAYRISGLEAETYASGVQLSLEAVQDSALELATSVISIAGTATDTTVSKTSESARSTLETIFAKLNTSVGGRSLFSGTATKSVALESSSTLLTELETLLSGATTAAAARSLAEAWFSDPGPTGFEALIYNGSAVDLSPFRVADGENIDVGVRADDERLRTTIMDAALISLMDSGTLSLNDTERRLVMVESGVSLQYEQESLAQLRASVGNAQRLLDNIEARQASERTAMQMARNDLIAADPYETAVRLEEVQFRLQSIYTITSRMSQLSLVNFL